MRHYLYTLSGLMVLSACNSDEIIQISQTEEISFTSSLEAVTRAATGIMTSTTLADVGNSINVYAATSTVADPSQPSSSTTVTKLFIDNFNFKDTSPSGFYSDQKYFWPNNLSDTHYLNFYAMYGATQADGKPGEIASYSPAPLAEDQLDVLVAKTDKITSKTQSGSVGLNFRHTLSQIRVAVSNSDPSLKIVITGLKVGGLHRTGDFKLSLDHTKTNQTSASELSTGVTLIPRSDWTMKDILSPTNDYTHDLSNAPVTLNGKVENVNKINLLETSQKATPWILLPQQLVDAQGKYANKTAPTTNDIDIAGAYLALEMVIYDKASQIAIVDKQWCCWPIKEEWKPGYCYSYIINAGSGGYQPNNSTDEDDEKELDPVIDSSDIIWFSQCTVDNWVEATTTNLP